MNKFFKESDFLCSVDYEFVDSVELCNIFTNNIKGVIVLTSKIISWCTLFVFLEYDIQQGNFKVGDLSSLWYFEAEKRNRIISWLVTSGKGFHSFNSINLINGIQTIDEKDRIKSNFIITNREFNYSIDEIEYRSLPVNQIIIIR